MAHDHSHARPGAGADQRRVAIALSLSAAYMVAEIAGGLWTGSLALLADAGHMLSDVLALVLSLAAIRIAQRPPTPARTYGFYRTEILAALAHGVLLVWVAVYVVTEAIERFETPAEVLGGPMLAIATGGLAVNLVSLAVLHAGREHSLNVRGAWLHVLSDALGSVGAMTAGALVWGFGWYEADPAASLAIGCLIIYSSWALLREAVAVLMEGTPAHLDVVEIQDALGDLPGVVAIHDLHVWTITSGMESLTGHVVVKEGTDSGALLQEICDLLYERFGIDHTTVQIEPEDFREPGSVCTA